MAVVNKVPELISAYPLEVARSKAGEWALLNSKWLKNVLDQHDSFMKDSQVELYQAAYDGRMDSIEEREKSRGDDINHKLFVNMAQLVIDTAVDYMTGKPIVWTFEDLQQEGNKQLLEDYRKEIMKMLRSGNSQRVLAEMLRQGSIGYYSAVITWVDENGEIDFEEFPVQEIVPVFDGRGKLRLVIRKYTVLDETDDNALEMTKLEVYDGKYVTYLVQDEVGANFRLDPEEEATGNPVQHFAGRIPVSVFVNGTPASYEERRKRVGVSDIKSIYSLLEELSSVMSDKGNTVDRMLDQFLLLKGVTTTEDEVKMMRKARALVLKNKESDASFLAPSQEDSAIENHLDRVIRTIHDTSNTPRLNEINGATATEIKVKYASLDIKAGKKELYFGQSIRDFIHILTDMLNARRILDVNKEADVYAMLNGLEKPPVELYDADWLQFTINRNMPQNFMEIAQIVGMLADKVPDSYLYELLWFIEDPVAALKEMKKQRAEDSKLQVAAGMAAMGYGGEFGTTGNENEDEEEDDSAEAST